jgi:hypothetical protein
MSSVILVQLFWNSFWLFWVDDSILCGDLDSYVTVKKRLLLEISKINQYFPIWKTLFFTYCTSMLWCVDVVFCRFGIFSIAFVYLCVLIGLLLLLLFVG